MKKISYFLFIPCLFLTSCIALHDGVLQQPLVKLEKNNFSYVRTVSGSATATYILGLGGNTDGLVQASLNKFRANLKPNQALVNITYDKRRQWFIIPLLYQQLKVYISADIVEFTNVGESNKIKRNDETIDNGYRDMQVKDMQAKGISPGSACLVDVNGRTRKAKFIKILEEGKFQVRLISNNKIIAVDEDNIFFK
jgi:hypothetical protein